MEEDDDDDEPEGERQSRNIVLDGRKILRLI